MSNKEIVDLLIKELEEERLTLFRSAANLDRIIEKIQLVDCENDSKEFVRDYIISRAQHRQNIAEIFDLEDGKVKEIFDKYLKLLE